MNFWGYFYGVIAVSVFLVALASRRWKIAISGSMLFASWAMTNIIILVRMNDLPFFSYLGFDFVCAEVVLFMIIHEFSWWKATALVSYLAQLFVHCAYWVPFVGIHAYYEILNIFYLVQCAAISTIYFPRQPSPQPERLVIRPRRRIPATLVYAAERSPWILGTVLLRNGADSI